MTKSGIPQGKPRTRFHIWGLLVPLGLLLILGLLPLTWISTLPELIPVHWDGSGQPDDFNAPNSFIWTMILIGLGTILFLWVLGIILGKDIMTRRVLVGTSVFCAVVTGGAPLLILWLMRTQSAEEVSVGFITTAALLAGFVLGSITGWLLPKDKFVAATSHPATSAPRTELSDSELGVWVTRTDSRAGYIIAGINVVVFTALIIATQLWWLVLFALLLSLVMVTMFAWNVRVDQTGLSVTSIARVPKRHIYLDEIESAEVSTVNAMSDFGGWGLRTGFSGSTGVILRSGLALQVNISGNRTFYVTVDDAATGAALLNALVDRSRPATES